MHHEPTLIATVAAAFAYAFVCGFAADRLRLPPLLGYLLAGIAIGCARAGFTESVGLAVLAMAFASVVTYTRAKAEVVGLHGEIGVAPRSERIVRHSEKADVGGDYSPEVGLSRLIRHFAAELCPNCICGSQ